MNSPMKNLIPLALLVFVVAACNLTSKLKSNKNDEASTSSSSSNTSNPSKINEPAEKPAPTDAQIAALANGEEVKWDEQGISWTLPPGWKKQTISTNSFNYSLGTQVFLIVNISAMAPDFPSDISLNATH